MVNLSGKRIGAFTYSHSQLTMLSIYKIKKSIITKQKTFKEEYVEFFKMYVDFKNEYLLMMLIRDKYVALTGLKIAR
jgi:hypothetical protein